LLLDIERIDILIAAWVIDTVIIKIYYEWWKQWKELNELKKIDWRIYSINLREAFDQVRMNYNEYFNSLISDEGSLRNKVLLIYKGLKKEEEELCKIEFIEKIIEKYNNWWNNYYIEWALNMNRGFYYYDSRNDEEFILNSLVKVTEAVEEEEGGIIKIVDKDIYELMLELFDKRFYPEQHKMIFEIIKKLHKNNNELLRKFLELKKEFDNFDSNIEDYTKKEKIIEFFVKLNSIKLKDDIKKE